MNLDKFPNPNEEGLKDQDSVDELDTLPKPPEEFKGLGKVDEEGLRKLIEETREKGLDENTK